MSAFAEPSPIQPELVDQVAENVASQFPNRVADLCQLVRISGIGWDAFDPANLDRSAEAVKALFESTGVFDSVRIERSMKTDGSGLGNPAVLAHRAAKNGKPHFLLYAHHDVQPPGDEAEWRTPPFEPTLKDDRIFGRGAADDKAGVVTHVTALNALRELTNNDFEVGISVFIEGEEEAGSLSFSNFLKDFNKELEADVIVVADSGNWTPEIPALTTTLRGVVSLTFEVQTLDHALHSGMFGGAVPDATMALTRILASFHTEDGSVAVQGLHKSEADAVPYDEAALRADSGLLDGVATIGTGSIPSRLWTSPSITVIGIDTMGVDVASNTLLPKAKATVSLRVAPGEDADRAAKLLEQHIIDHAPFGAKVTILEVVTGQPFAVDTSGWAVKLAKDALAKAFGNPSLEMGVGGSIPFIADLTQNFPQAQILVTGVEDADSRAHSPNESVHLTSLRGAMVAEALMLLQANQS